MRPKKNIDIEKVAADLRLGVSKKKIAKMMGCSYGLLWRHIRDHKRNGTMPDITPVVPVTTIERIII
jgi:transposase